MDKSYGELAIGNLPYLQAILEEIKKLEEMDVLYIRESPGSITIRPTKLCHFLLKELYAILPHKRPDDLHNMPEKGSEVCEIDEIIDLAKKYCDILKTAKEKMLNSHS